MYEWIDQIVLSVICVQRVRKAEDKDLLVEQCAMTRGSSGLWEVIVLLEILFKL